MKRIKSFFTDFKKFISKGNVIDLSIGVIIGSAFSAITTALTNKIIMPFINFLLSLGGSNGLENAYTFLSAEDKALVDNYFSMLGKADSMAQKAYFSSVKDVLKKAEADAISESKKYGDLYVKMGFLLGLLILILII